MAGKRRKSACEPLQRSGEAAKPSRNHLERRCAAEQAVLIVNARGAVDYCSNGAAGILGSSVEQILGQPIASVIPELPFKDTTPGYNVAYARFWSDRPAWRKSDCSAPTGEAVPVELRFKSPRRSRDAEYTCIVTVRRVEA